MFPIFQRYNFESKSQRMNDFSKEIQGCFRYFKDTILKANHNFRLLILRGSKLFPIFQRYNFESKSQQERTFSFFAQSCFRYFKDTILKANHNTYNVFFSIYWLFPIFQRYNFESKSQQSNNLPRFE